MQAKIRTKGSAKPGKKVGISRKTKRRFVFPRREVQGSSLPGKWDAGMMLYPSGTLQVNGRALGLISDGQWETARGLLERGYVLGFIAFEHEVAAVVSEAVQALGVPVVVEADVADGMVYFARKPER